MQSSTSSCLPPTVNAGTKVPFQGFHAFDRMSLANDLPDLFLASTHLPHYCDTCIRHKLRYGSFPCEAYVSTLSAPTEMLTIMRRISSFTIACTLKPGGSIGEHIRPANITGL